MMAVLRRFLRSVCLGTHFYAVSILASLQHLQIFYYAQHPGSGKVAVIRGIALRGHKGAAVTVSLSPSLDCF